MRKETDRIPDIELAHLIAFKHVVELGSFTRAAEALYRTQPAVSHQIRSLEDILGQPLLERSHRHIHLTHAGEVFYGYAQRILSLISESTAALEDMAIGARGRIVIAAIGTSSIYVLPDFLYEFRMTHPNIQVVLMTAGGEEVRNMVMTDQVDLGIIGSHIATPELERIPLFDDHIALLVHPEHPCAAAGSAPLSAFVDEPFIQFGGWTSWRNYVYAMFDRIGARPHEQFQVDSIDAVKRLVERGLGFTIAPVVSAKTEIESGLLVPIELTDVGSLTRKILLIYHRDKYMTAYMRAFIHELLTYMKGLAL